MLMSERPMPPDVKLRVGDRRLAVGSGGVYQHVNPATGKIQADIPLSGIVEMNDAIDAAHTAFDVWRRWAPTARRDALLRLAALLESNGKLFAAYHALDNGSPLAIGNGAWQQAKAWTNYYAGWADKLDGAVGTNYMSDTDFTYSLAEPYGVIAVIITWNGPLISLGMKVSPALAAGNTVVVKPSEFTPFSADLFGQLVQQAGIPDGVCNIVPGGVDAAEALVAHPRVQKVTFTGGPATARKILASCAQHLKPAVLELGGKSANLIFPDANLDHACPYGVQLSVMRMSGQGCSFPTRMLVHQDIYDEVSERVAALARAIKIGDPFDPSVDMGPVVNEAALTRILGVIENAKSQNAGKLVAGGARVGGELRDGFFVQPTIFTDVDPDSDLAQLEVFGPVLSIIRFSSEEQAIKIANNTGYGLAAHFHTRDVRRVHRLAGELRGGTIMVNGGRSLKPGLPFGGDGLSGYGREGGRQGIDEFIRPKTVAIGPN
jgi:aldehyde dehydrogenase (NAD+)